MNPISHSFTRKDDQMQEKVATATTDSTSSQILHRQLRSRFVAGMFITALLLGGVLTFLLDSSLLSSIRGDEFSASARIDVAYVITALILLFLF